LDHERSSLPVKATENQSVAIPSTIGRHGGESGDRSVFCRRPGRPDRQSESSPVLAHRKGLGGAPLSGYKTVAATANGADQGRLAGTGLQFAAQTKNVGAHDTLRLALAYVVA
jgi:hypothetical protein